MRARNFIRSSACLTLLAAFVGGCSSGESSSAGADGTNVSDFTAISQAEIDAAANLPEMYVADPKLGRAASAKVIDTDEFDGTRSSTVLVKDGERLFRVHVVSSNAAASPSFGQHGAPPNFRESRYFLLLNKPGTDWAIANHGTKPSTRHAQILEALANTDYPDDVKLLGDTPSRQKIVWFNSSLFLVSGDGMADRCKSESANCSALWRRVDNGEDPFDAR